MNDVNALVAMKQPQMAHILLHRSSYMHSINTYKEKAHTPDSGTMCSAVADVPANSTDSVSIVQ